MRIRQPCPPYTTMLVIVWKRATRRLPGSAVRTGFLLFGGRRVPASVTA